ncbi:hypothetical protein CEE37_09070 [candidate division LCP-89 bacterium B3_LCP]|uniref:Prepilin peptidase n=1 Tax=candidate division LCP-89 bacterium B3_LCP TaxID=2012998 RepID=A0A532UZR8_UNCL8|nr:MAG: hypothetical protein CEE37_09070 [candidate division LCP-89 bacterium B3_LCP]
MQLQISPQIASLTIWADAWNLLSWDSSLGLALSIIVGSILGSFANVVIHRLPSGKSLIKPASHCPSCGQSIPFYLNVPFFSYFFLKGKASCCGTPLSPRYPIVELLCALILGSLYILEGWSASFGFLGIWMMLLIILAAIDIEHYRLPNALVGFGLLVSFAWMIISPQQSWLQALLGLMVGIVIAGLTMLIGKVMKGRFSGMGDLKLAAVLGFTFGPGRFIILYLCAVLFAVFFSLLFYRRVKDLRVPMGPFFAIGAWMTILAGREIVQWYLGFIY